ncbi:hypothetical protein ACK350_07150 [Aeromonas veronii]
MSIVSFYVGQGFFLVEMIFFFPLFFIPFYYRSLGFFEKDKLNSILKHFHSLFLISFFVLFVVNCIQVVLFISLGRLPALAWKGSLSVRFGSIFDDPNGFAIILSLFSFLYFGLKRFITKFIFVLMFLFCLLSTQSLTGVASVFISFMVVLFYRGFVLRERSSFNSFVLLSFLMLTSTVVVGVWFYSYVENFLLIKSGSIAEHAKSTLFMDGMTFYDYFIGEPLGPVAESTYLNMLANFGLFFLFLYVLMILYVIRQGLKSLAQAGSMIEKNIYSSLVCFVLCVSLSGVNLPMMSVFPVNYLFYFACGFVLCFSYAERECNCVR